MNCYGESPNPNPDINFISQKPACTLTNGKLVLAKAWPFGSWEDCAYSILGLANQINNQKMQLEKTLKDITQSQQPKK